MSAEYSYSPTQTVAADDNILFTQGSRACKKGYIMHRDDSGIFTLRGAGNSCKAIYKVNFNANIAIAMGGTVEPISVSISLNGETLNNSTAVVTPAAIGNFFNVSLASFIEVPCGCCRDVSIENTSATTAIDVQNANIIFERVA